jgi:hypothetical protein
VTVAEFMAEWERCEHWLAAALATSRDDRTMEDVFLAVCRGDMQFWPGEDSAMVTQLLVQPKGAKECNVFLAGGTLATLEKMLVEVERFAKANNATTMTVLGRRGWERSFLTTSAGYMPVATLYRKDLP